MLGSSTNHSPARVMKMRKYLYCLAAPLILAGIFLSGIIILSPRKMALTFYVLLCFMATLSIITAIINIYLLSLLKEDKDELLLKKDKFLILSEISALIPKLVFITFIISFCFTYDNSPAFVNLTIFSLVLIFKLGLPAILTIILMIAILDVMRRAPILLKNDFYQKTNVDNLASNRVKLFKAITWIIYSLAIIFLTSPLWQAPGFLDT